MSMYNIKPTEPMTEEEKQIFNRIKYPMRYYSPKELRCDYEILESLAKKGFLVAKTFMIRGDVFDPKRHLRFKKRHVI